MQVFSNSVIDTPVYVYGCYHDDVSRWSEFDSTRPQDYFADAYSWLTASYSLSISSNPHRVQGIARRLITVNDHKRAGIDDEYLFWPYPLYIEPGYLSKFKQGVHANTSSGTTAVYSRARLEPMPSGCMYTRLSISIGLFDIGLCPDVECQYSDYSELLDL